VELYGQLDAGYGHAWTSVKSDSSPLVSPPRSSDSVPFDAGIGLRLWLHPHFALGATALVQGSWFTVSTENLSVNPDGSTMKTPITTSGANLSLGGALQILGVF
jgi:hypothetical protein